ncbi:MAG: Ig-like domain-containing protein [Lentisphaeria bacterium]
MRGAIFPKLMLLLLALLIVTAGTASLSAAALSLAGHDSAGAVMANGSGYGQGVYFRPLVFDDRRVAFIAPMPEYASSETLFRGTYEIEPLATDPKAGVLFPGRNEFAMSLGSEWPLTNWALAADRDGQVFYALRQEQTSDLAGATYPFLRRLSGGVIDGPELVDMQLSEHSRLCCSANGTRLFVYERGRTTIRRYAVTSSSLTAQDDLVLPTGGEGQPAYDGRGIATNYNGRTVYFAGSTGRDEEGLGIFSYEVNNAKLSEIALKVCQLGVDAEPAASATNGVVAFRSTNKLLVDLPSTDTGFRIYAASPADGGGYSYQLCSKDLHDANAPQLSYDGRYVVFCARATQDGIQQVWRFDRETGEQRPVSKTATAWANRDCLAPALSPNGRYAAFVSAATNLGGAGVNQPQVWWADVGPTLQSGNLVLTPGKKPLPLQADAASASARLHLSVEPGTPVPAGVFTDSKGKVIESGASYSLAERPLPWNYSAVEADIAKIYSMQIQLVDGQYSSDYQIFTITVNDSVFELLSLTGAGAFWPGEADYHSLSMSADGNRVAFVSDADLLAESAPSIGSRVYLRDVLRAKTYSVSLATGKNSNSACISGDGRHVFFVTSDGLLYDYWVNTGLREVIAEGVDSYAPLAVSHAGDVLLYEKGGGLSLNREGVETALPLPADVVDVINPALSRDGQTAIFLAKTAGAQSYSLYAYYASTPDSAVLLLDGVCSASLSMSGATALVQQEDGQGSTLCKRIAVGGAERQERVLPIAGASPVLSGNARIAAYVRLDGNGKKQAYSYDFSTLRERVASKMNGVLGDADCDAEVPLVLSTRGDNLAFVSAAGNLAVGDTNGGNDLFRAELPIATQQAPVLTALGAQATPTNRVFSLVTDEDVPLFLPMAYSDADGDDALPEILSAPLYGSVEFIGPDAQRSWYAIQYRPAENYFGAESFVFRLWDGAERSEGYTVNVTVNSVNDPPYWLGDIPADLTSYTVSEGQTVHSQQLKAYADDVDLRNPAPHVDAISFSLTADTPEWVKIDSATGKLTFTPGYDVARRDQNEGKSEFSFGCLVKDKAGATACLDIGVMVKNVNRAPVISSYPAVVFEGIEVPHTAFVYNDPDVEDPPESLTLVFTPVGGTWHSTATGRTFIADAAAVNSTTSTIKAKDSGGMKSETETISIRLVAMAQSLQALWPGADGAPGSALRVGWQLLTMPYDLDEAGLEQLLEALGAGTAIWRWDGGRGSYVVARSLGAGEGFWCYLPIVPGNLALTVKGRREWAPREYQPGWQLVGLRSDETTLGLSAANAGSFLWGLATGKHALPQPLAGPFAIGRGYWLFQNDD